MELLKEHPEGDAKLTILSYAIKTVPIPVLRVKFNDCRSILSDLLETYIENSNFNAIENVSICLLIDTLFIINIQLYRKLSLTLDYTLYDHITLCSRIFNMVITVNA